MGPSAIICNKRFTHSFTILSNSIQCSSSFHPFLLFLSPSLRPFSLSFNLFLSSFFGLDGFVTGELAPRLRALLARLLGLLQGHQLVSVQGDEGSHVSTVSGRLLELFSYLEYLSCISNVPPIGRPSPISIVPSHILNSASHHFNSSIVPHLPLYHFPIFKIQNHRVHRVATAAFWRTFSDEGKISPGW